MSLGKGSRVCCVVCEPSFTLLSCLCGLDFWKTAFGFQSLVLPSLPAPHRIIRDIIQWQPPPSFGCFNLAPFSTLAAWSSCLNELRKDPMCTRPQCPPFWEVEGQELSGGDSWASMHQCSQSWWTETLATKASDPRFCPRLFLWRAGIGSQLNWFIGRSSRLATVIRLFQIYLYFWFWLQETPLIIQQSQVTKINS